MHGTSMIRYGRRPAYALAAAAAALMGMGGVTPAHAAPPPVPGPARAPASPEATSSRPGASPAGMRPLPAPATPIRLDRLLASVPRRTTDRLHGVSTALLQDVQTRRCLDGGPTVTTETCTSTAAQLWHPGPNGAVVEHLTRRCLDSDFAGNVYTFGCNGGSFQAWYFAADRTIRDYRTGRCLDSNAAGDVYTLPCNGGRFQKWIVWVEG